MRRPRPSASSPTAVTDSRGWTSSVPSAPNDSSEDVQRIRIGRLVCGRGHDAPGGIGAPGGRVTAKRYNDIVSAPHSSRPPGLLLDPRPPPYRSAAARTQERLVGNGWYT